LRGIGGKSMFVYRFHVAIVQIHSVTVPYNTARVRQGD
jgi:hypothetical protein